MTGKETIFDPSQQKNKVIDYLMRNPKTIPHVLSSLTPEDTEFILQQYGFSRYSGYIDQSADHAPEVVLAFGAKQPLDASGEQGIDFRIGNYAVSATLEPALTPYGRAYSLVPQSSTMIEYLKPELKWRRDGTMRVRQWQLDSAGSQDPKVSSLLGLVALSYLAPEYRNRWRREMPNQELFTPSYVPSLAAIRQGDLLHHSILNGLEAKAGKAL